jgi:hypothetical protein
MAKKVTILQRTLRRSKHPEPDKPDLPRRLFWEMRYDELRWRVCHRFVIERVLDWGNDEERDELIRYYGRSLVRNTLKKKSIYLMDHTLQRACDYFKVKPEETLCYTRKRSRPGHWL